MRIFQIRDSRSALIIVRIRSISMRNGFARSRFTWWRISGGGYINDRMGTGKYGAKKVTVLVTKNP